MPSSIFLNNKNNLWHVGRRAPLVFFVFLERKDVYNTIDPLFFYSASIRSSLHDTSLFKYNKANDCANNDFEIIVALFSLWNRWIRNLANILKFFFFFFFFLEVVSIALQNIKYFARVSKYTSKRGNKNFEKK